MKTFTLFKTDWFEVKTTPDDYQFIEVPQGIGVLPCRKNFTEFLIRFESNPLYTDKVITVITGRQDDGETKTECCIRELVEEAGYLVDDARLVELGKLNLGKSTIPEDMLFIADCTGLIAEEIKGDGSNYEAESFNQWISLGSLKELMSISSCAYLHAIVAKMYFKGLLK